LWRPIGLWDVEDCTVSIQLVHRWQWGSQFYCHLCFAPQKHFLVLVSVRDWVNPRSIIWLKGLDKLKEIRDLIRTQTHGLLACNVVPQPTMLLHVPYHVKLLKVIYKDDHVKEMINLGQNPDEVCWIFTSVFLTTDNLWQKAAVSEIFVRDTYRHELTILNWKHQYSMLEFHSSFIWMITQSLALNCNDCQ
jgi:hypothetical protein